MTNKFIALIPCAGMGSRFSNKMPKQYFKIGNKTVLEYTIRAFINTELIDEIIVVVNPHDTFIDNIIEKINNPKVIVARCGGDNRAQTVLNGLDQLEIDKDSWILVHDAARCCITPELINMQISELRDDQVGGILAIAAIDTIKYVDGNVIERTFDRTKIFLAQTPQMFRFEILKTALKNANLSIVTDEASAVESLNKKVRIVLGSQDNIKITMPEDIKKAQLILMEK